MTWRPTIVVVHIQAFWHEITIPCAIPVPFETLFTKYSRFFPDDFLFFMISKNFAKLKMCAIFDILQALEFDREGLTKLKKAVKAIYNSGNSKLAFLKRMKCNVYTIFLYINHIWLEFFKKEKF